MTGMRMYYHCKLFRCYLYAMVLFIMAPLTVFGQIHSASVLMIGCLRNETANAEYDNIHCTLQGLLADLPRFPRTLLDTTITVDSFPDEASLLKARNVNADYVLWGLVDSFEPGIGISLHILDMAQASVSHITIMINRNDDGKTVAETIRSKLLLWLQRTTMVQLIVTTSPAAASVLLDGKPLGSTPFEGMVQPGTYRLELKRKPFLPILLPVSFISGNTYQYDFALNTDEKKTDRVSVVKWLGISVVCLGAGGGAHWQYGRARERYRAAVPPADFDRLYHRAVAWEVGRDLLFAAAGAALTGMIFKVVF